MYSIEPTIHTDEYTIKKHCELFKKFKKNAVYGKSFIRKSSYAVSVTTGGPRSPRGHM